MPPWAPWPRWRSTGVRELSLHVLDILQNAVEAGATRVDLTISEEPALDRLTVTVADNGRGMDEATVARVTDPFYTSRSTRHVGLGLPLWAAAAQRADGNMRVRSQPGVGTAVSAEFRLSHPDRQPLGDMPGTIMAFLLSGQATDLHYVHSVGDLEFELDSAEVRANLDGTPVGHPAVRQWLSDYIAEGEASLGSQA